jgi:flavin-dependent dehydrogenase
MAGAVHPKVGPNWLLAGDAAGAANPFNGDGIDGALESGRMAARLVADAIDTRNGLVLQRYPVLLAEHHGLSDKMGRVFARAISRPALLRELTRVGVHSHSLMEWAVRIMTNLLRPDERGPAELAYAAMAGLVRFVPDPARVHDRD